MRREEVAHGLCFVGREVVEDDMDLSLRWLRIAGIRFLRDEFEDALQAYRSVAEGASEPTIKRQARYGMVDCYERTFQYDLAVKLLEETGADPKNAGYIERRIASMREQQRQRNFSPTIESQR